MNYQYVRNNMEFIEFLGFCPMKGFIYSEYMGDGKYRILALNDGEVTTLINFTGIKQEVKEEVTV